uniref:Uncharacterized protein n=1 Tax=uncultured marine virus TaxID=186617 RepID=A0A0F7L6B3_9VIRU|nr:hypothetical protein [uncultured marine virus]
MFSSAFKILTSSVIPGISRSNLFTLNSLPFPVRLAITLIAFSFNSPFGLKISPLTLLRNLISGANFSSNFLSPDICAFPASSK